MRKDFNIEDDTYVMVTTHLEMLARQQKNIRMFPANIIHDGSEEVVSLFPSVGKGNGNPYNYSGVTYDNKNTSMFNGDKPQAPSNYNDSGSASRFFYTAKASKKIEMRDWTH